MGFVGSEGMLLREKSGRGLNGIRSEPRISKGQGESRLKVLCHSYLPLAQQV